MKTVFAVLSLIVAATSAQAGDAMIEPDDWRAMTSGKTLYYFKDGELYGKEYYAPDGGVTFRFPSGLCVEGRWAHADGKYCFAFQGDDQLHCFWHVMREDKVVVIGEADGEEQTVDRFEDGEPMGCGSAI